MIDRGIVHESGVTGGEFKGRRGTDREQQQPGECKTAET